MNDRSEKGRQSFRQGRADRRDRIPRSPITARDVALQAVTDVLRQGAYASQALDRALSKAEALKDEDKRLAASLFGFTVENCIRIDWLLGQRMDTLPVAAVHDILRLAMAQLLFMDRIPDHAAVDEAVKQTRQAGCAGLTGLVNGVLRGVIRARDEGSLSLPDADEDPSGHLSVACSIARPAAERMLSAYGPEDAMAMLNVHGGALETAIRPNRTKIDVGTLGTMLTQEGLEWRAGTVPDALLVKNGGHLAKLPGYRKGLFSIQGESSMLAALAVEPRPGMQILDACAAPGGKTCLMAERMGGSGRVFAWDIHPKRVELIRAAAYRLWLENVRPSEHDATKSLASMELGMDAVLTDVPCSGMGVLAEKPDIRLKLTEQELTELPRLQARILEACSQMVRVGGLLVYTTCTLLPQENEQQIERFLNAHPEFEPEAGEDWLPMALRGRMNNGMLLIRPDKDGMDGFFIARMRRRKA